MRTLMKDLTNFVLAVLKVGDLRDLVACRFV